MRLFIGLESLLSKEIRKWPIYALMHYLGQGTERNAELAIAWTEKAISIGIDALILRGLLAEDPIENQETSPSRKNGKRLNIGIH